MKAQVRLTIFKDGSLWILKVISEERSDGELIYRRSFHEWDEALARAVKMMADGRV